MKKILLFTFIFSVFLATAQERVKSLTIKEVAEDATADSLLVWPNGSTPLKYLKYSTLLSRLSSDLSPTVPTLQSVTDEGATTDNPITISNTGTASLTVYDSGLFRSTYIGSDRILFSRDGFNYNLKTKTQTGNYDLYLPYLTANDTIAIKSEIPTNNNQLTNGEGYLTAADVNDLTTSAPFLEELVPDTYLPSTTGNFILNGSYFSQSMVDNINSSSGILVESHTINYATFVSSQKILVNLTTSATDGTYDITLNNGVSATFTDVLQVVNGTVYTPNTIDWIITEPVTVDDSNVFLKTYDSNGSAEWKIELDYTVDFSISFRTKASPLGTIQNELSGKLFSLQKTSNSSDLFWVSHAGNHRFNSVLDPIAYDAVGGGAGNINNKVEFRYLSGIMYAYYNNTLVHTFSDTFSENLKLKVTVKTIDVYDIKYIDLDDSSGTIQQPIYYQGVNVGLDVTNFDNNLDNTVTNVQKLADAVNDLAGGGSPTTDASDLTSGVLADARVQESNVTQHEAALTIDGAQLTGMSAYLTTANAASTYAPLVSASLTTPDIGAATGTSLITTGIINANNNIAANQVKMGAPSSGYPGIWFGANATTPTLTNYSFLYDASNGVILNTPASKDFFFRVGNTTMAKINGTTNNFEVTNTVIADAFEGDGSGLTNVGGVTQKTISANYELLPADDLIYVDNSTAITIDIDTDTNASFTEEKLYTFVFEQPTNQVTFDFLTDVDGTDFVTYANTKTVTIQRVDTDEWKVLNAPEPLASTFTGTAIPLDKYYQHDDTGTDTATWTIGNSENGGFAEILINLSTEPTITGASQITNTASFIADTLMVLTIKNILGTEYYYFTEL